MDLEDFEVGDVDIGDDMGRFLAHLISSSWSASFNDVSDRFMPITTIQKCLNEFSLMDAYFENNRKLFGHPFRFDNGQMRNSESFLLFEHSLSIVHCMVGKRNAWFALQ